MSKTLKNHPTADAAAKPTKEAAEQPNPNALFAPDGSNFNEGMDAGAYALPFLAILQALSPQVQRGQPSFVNGANPGLLFNTVTKELFETVDVSVVRRTHTICRWKRREDGGGFVDETEATVDAIQAFAALPLDEKKRRIQVVDGKTLEVTEHRNFFCQIVRNGTAHEPLLISMTKSQLKAARDWNSNISLKSFRDEAGPRLASEIWRVGTVMRTKDGNSWYVFAIAHLGRHSNAQLYGEVRAAIAQAKEIKLLARPAQEEEPSEEI